MSSADVISKREAAPEAEPVDMKLEVVLLEVSNVDRAKAFYENLGWRLDIDVVAGDFRGVQMTPHNSEASSIFGKGVTSAKPGSADSLVVAVDDIDAARDDLIARGVEVSEVFHYAGGPSEKAHADHHLVGLVRALPERASERQQSGGGGGRRRPPHGDVSSDLTGVAMR